MSATGVDVIAEVLAEVVANEDDPEWERWVRDRMRLQEQLHGLRAQRDALASKVLHAKAGVADGPEPRKTTRSEKRRAMGLGALFPLAEAVAHLPMSDSDARRWLRQEGLVGQADGREVVAWHRVVEAAYKAEADSTTAPLPPTARSSKPLPRVRLGRSGGRG